MESCKVRGPSLLTLADLKNYLRTEPLYFQVLENYLHNAANLINELRAKMERNERQTHEEQVTLHLLERNQVETWQEKSVPSLVDDDGNLEEEMEVVVSEPFLNEEVINVAPPATVSDRREIETVIFNYANVTKSVCSAIRSRTIRVPMLEQDRNNEVPAGPAVFQVPSLEALPAHYRRALAAPEIDPYMVTKKVDGSTAIGCGFCQKEFGTLKGWRIHASRTLRQNGFCQKCNHFVKMPHAASTEVIEAVMEFHSMEWCPKVTKVVVYERTAKGRKLELVGRIEDAKRYFIPDK
ncbi:hypothetical protein QQG55_21755 [Brugia pahangi]|uniref:Zinc finger protein n=1 Tax=Brugia pahangi TaxID=6280 RepID=A0A0N4T502_BRUPA|nr:unnamed protein product [Brugia pahangi]